MERFTATRAINAKTYHVHGPDWLRTGAALCGRNTGYGYATTSACDSVAQMYGRVYGAGYELCRNCARKLGGVDPLPRVETIREVRDADRRERPIGETFGFLPSGRRGNVCELFAGGAIARVRWDTGYTSDIGSVVLRPIPGADGITRSIELDSFGAELTEACESCGKTRETDPDFCAECLSAMKRARAEQG